MREGQAQSVPYAVQVALLIKGLRSVFRLSQSELAQAAKVSRPTINRIETFRNLDGVKASTLEKLLSVFRDRGVGIHLTDEGARVYFLPEALLAAWLRNQADNEENCGD